MTILLRLLITALALLGADALFEGIVVTSFLVALVVAIILGLMNLIIKPILTLLTLPITILTLGLFSFVINAFLFWLASTFIEGFDITGWIPALIGSLFLSAVQMVGYKLIEKFD